MPKKKPRARSSNRTSIEDLVGELAFALTEIEPDFNHLLSGPLQGAIGYAQALTYELPPGTQRRQYKRIYARVDELVQMYHGFSEDLEAIAGGSYHDLFRLPQEEISVKKRQLGARVLEFVDELDPLLKEIERGLARVDSSKIPVRRKVHGQVEYVRRSHRAVLEEIGLLRKLVNGFRDFRATTSGLSLSGKADLRKVIRDAVRVTAYFRNRRRRFAEGVQRKIQVKVDLPKGKLHVPMHESIVFRLVLAALSNSMKAIGKQGDPRGEVHIKVAPRGRKVRLSIKDDGPGIPEERLAELAEGNPVKPDPVRGGSGMGIFLARTLLGSVEGRVEISSKTSGRRRGTTVHMHMPLMQRAQARGGTRTRRR